MILNYEEVKGIPAATIIPSEGNLDNADAFKKELSLLIDKGGKYVILNFRNVDYVDSSFLGALVSCLKYAMSKGTDILLVELRQDIYSLLHLIRMDKVFKIYKNYQEAIENN
jgi:anti-sigma B factor antagonist